MNSYLQLVIMLIIFVVVLAATYFFTKWMADFQKDKTSNGNIEVIETANPQPRALIERMTQAVGDFVGDTEQSDDLTMLALQWKK